MAAVFVCSSDPKDALLFSSVSLLSSKRSDMLPLDWSASKDVARDPGMRPRKVCRRFFREDENSDRAWWWPLPDMLFLDFFPRRFTTPPEEEAAGLDANWENSDGDTFSSFPTAPPRDMRRRGMTGVVDERWRLK